MSDILQLSDVHTYLGQSYIIQGISLRIEHGSVVALLGRNGMGKTTTIGSIIKFNPLFRGQITFKDKDITHKPTYQVCQMGMSLVPQGRRIFKSLTVTENLMLAARHTDRNNAWNLDRVFCLFPRLKERARNRGIQLSGGEAQMLAIGRALISNPDLILMDEPSEGLAPLIIQEIGRVIKELRETGVSILLAEQHVPLALSVAGYVYVINKGRLVFEGTPQQLESNDKVMSEYLAV